MAVITSPAPKLRRSRTRLIAAILAVLAAAAVLIIIFGHPRSYVPLDKEEIETVSAAYGSAKLSPSQRKLVDSALSLVGKVHYFWGGKSFSIGDDPEWGQLKKVTSSGSPTTNTTREYGLDCSGFIAWCFLQTGLTKEHVENRIGLGTYNQWEHSKEIGWNELQIGDLAFQNKPGKDNHVGICIGFEASGEPLFAHCASKFNNVVITGRGNVFNYPRRMGESLR